MESNALLFAGLAILLIAGAALWISNLRLRRGLEAHVRAAQLHKNLHEKWHEKSAADYDSASFGYGALDEAGRFTDINDTALRWLGCEREALLGKLGLADFMTEEVRSRYAADLARVHAGKAFAGEYELISRSGAGTSVIVSMQPLPAALGATPGEAHAAAPARIRATLFDITPQVRASRALSATLDHTPNVAIQWFDRDGRVRYWNEASTRLFGWRADETLGRTLGEIGFYTQAQGQDFIDVLRDLDPNGGALNPEESTFFRKDGTLGVVVSTLFPIPGPAGEHYVACMDVDVTERYRSEERLRATLENTPGVAVQWYDGEARVLYWNPTSEMLYGIDAEDAVGRRLDELLLTPEEHREFVAFLDSLKSARNTADSRQISVRGRHGVEVTVLRRTCMIPGERGEAIFVCMEVDLTDVRAAEREREQLDTILKRVTEAMPVCLSYIDTEGRYVWTNAHNAERLRTSPDRMIGKAARDVYLQATGQWSGAAFDTALAGTPHFSETQWRGGDGAVRTYERYLMPDKGAEGEVRGITSVLVDITARKDAEHKIYRLNRVHSVLSNISAALVRATSRQELFDTACRIAVTDGGFGMAWVGAFNKFSARIDSVAWNGLDLQDMRVMEALSRDQSFAACTLLASCLQTRRPALENDLSRDNPGNSLLCQRASELGYRSVIFLPLNVGEEVAGVLGLMSKERDFFTDDEVRLLSNLSSDVAFALDAIDKETRINYLAYYDSLTGLPNRTLFHERLGQLLLSAKQRESKLALLVVDIRRFRFVNETLGRESGDKLLRAVAERFLESWPQPDYVGRLSGVHFGMAMAGYDNDALLTHAVEHAAVEALRLPFVVDGREVSIACATGIAVCPDNGADVETLLKNAEAALTQAKSAAEPYMFYRRQMNERMAEGLIIENRMRRALDREQFLLHYQPKIDLATARICGFEALLRWEDPEDGLVPPNQFIPILEETGMIVDVGQWVMRRVLHDHASWRALGLNAPRIAVNVSAIQMLRRDFVDQVRALLEGVPPHGVVLDFEITESVLMQDVEGSIQKLRAVRDLGVNIAIDDFGTGYSSLAYLSRLPVNALKIDQSFTRGMLYGGEHMSIVSTIISLAQAMRMKVIAEGVETKEQLNVLRSLGCDEIQGYLVSRPVPSQNAAGMLREGAVDSAQSELAAGAGTIGTY